MSLWNSGLKICYGLKKLTFTYSFRCWPIGLYISNNYELVLIWVKVEQCLFSYISRLVILGFRKWSIRPSSLVVSGEFHSWSSRYDSSFLFYIIYKILSIYKLFQFHIELTYKFFHGDFRLICSILVLFSEGVVLSNSLVSLL